MLHDAKAIHQDHLSAVYARPGEKPDFSLITDGLKAEREQGITIDVAYRYFATANRRFIVADAPGHEQYTRNMATGASTAELAVLLVDARKGLLPQTCRHSAIARMMGIRSFAIVVNKMDLVDFDEGVFRRIECALTAFFERLGAPRLVFIPCCAPDGDNVVYKSRRMDWYAGPCLLEHLENAPVCRAEGPGVFRYPVQWVSRTGTGRFYAGRVASGGVRVGDSVLCLPSRRTARVTGVLAGGDAAEAASSPLSAAIQLDADVDVGRGDMLCSPDDPPAMLQRFRATILWLSITPLSAARPYLVKHTARYVCGTVAEIEAVIDPVTLDRRASQSLTLNEFAEVWVETHHPLYANRYEDDRVTGSFIMVDPISNETVAAGMIASVFDEPAGERSAASQTRGGMVVWLTGLSSAGKSTIAQALYERLWAAGRRVELLDGDVVRQHLSKDLGFTKADRDENIARIGFLAELLARNGVIAIVAAISPYRDGRDAVRQRVPDFVEVYVNAPLPVLEERDRKGIYRRCRAGEIHGVTGIDDPYEAPLHPEVECRTDTETLAESVAKALRAVEMRLSGEA
jgi:bifunctional enzyme CysN/CysC